MSNIVTPGQVYKSLEDQRRFNRYRTLRVLRVGKPHPIYPGRLRKDGIYAWCVSTVHGKLPTKATIATSRLLSPAFELIEQPAAIPAREGDEC